MVAQKRQNKICQQKVFECLSPQNPSNQMSQLSWFFPDHVEHC